MISKLGRQLKVLRDVTSTVFFPGRVSISTLSDNLKVKIVPDLKYYTKLNLQTTLRVSLLKGFKILGKRQFCSSNEINDASIIKQDFVNDSFQSESIARDKNEKTLIPKMDEKLIASRFLSTIDRLQSLKATKDGFYIKVTKTFLTDPDFLRFAYHSIKNKEGNLTIADPKDETLDGISSE